MSLSLTRRIARTALLVAAGAAPVLGAAGAASAADLATDLPNTPKVSGLTALDSSQVGRAADLASQQVGNTTGALGGQAVEQAGPAAGKALGKVADDSASQTLPRGLTSEGSLPMQAASQLTR